MRRSQRSWVALLCGLVLVFQAGVPAAANEQGDTAGPSPEPAAQEAAAVQPAAGGAPADNAGADPGRTVREPAVVAGQGDTATPDPGLAVLDLIVTRPLGAVVTALGLAAFVAWSPVALATDTVEDTWNRTVVRAADYTFKRPLGDL